MKRWCLLIFAAPVFLVGCAELRYSQLTGNQSWPTGSGTMADKGYAIPVYMGWPDKPYRVIGSIRFANPNGPWQDGDTDRAASMAKTNGGDALIMRYGAESGVGAIAGGAADPLVMASRQMTALVIKWKTPNEIAQEQALLQRFESEFKAKHPDLPITSELVSIGKDYMAYLGLGLDSPSGFGKLEEVLTDVLRSGPEEKTAKWLYKGSVRSAALTSSYTEDAFGVATVSRTGDSVTLISSEGKTELHLSGTVKEGQLTGQLGATLPQIIFSGKAEGVLVPRRISLTCQAQTADGIVQSSFTLVR